jgi:hypothetical protein
MKSDLDLLIETYEVEKQSLESSVKNYLNEDDYLYAHYHQKALWRVNSELQLLHSFKGTLYEEQQYLERLIDMVKKIEEEDFIKSIYEKRIIEKRDEIQRLSEASRNFNDSQEIDDALFDLYEGRFKRFRLHLINRDEDFYLEFELISGTILCISVKIINILYGDDPDDSEESQIRLFEGLGFKLNDVSDMLIYKYDMNGFKDAITIKILLARIVYEVCYMGSGQQAKLEYFK